MMNFVLERCGCYRGTNAEKGRLALRSSLAVSITPKLASAKPGRGVGLGGILTQELNYLTKKIQMTVRRNIASM
jgi:hypothetical protein